MLCPDVDFIIGFQSGKRAGKGSDKFTIINMKRIIEMPFHLLFPVQHGRFGNNTEGAFNHSPEF